MTVCTVCSCKLGTQCWCSSVNYEREQPGVISQTGAMCSVCTTRSFYYTDDTASEAICHSVSCPRIWAAYFCLLQCAVMNYQSSNPWRSSHSHVERWPLRCDCYSGGRVARLNGTDLNSQWVTYSPFVGSEKVKCSHCPLQLVSSTHVLVSFSEPVWPGLVPLTCVTDKCRSDLIEKNFPWFFVRAALDPLCSVEVAAICFFSF